MAKLILKTILETISCQLPYAEIKNEAAVVMAITKQQHPRRPESTIPTGSKRGDDLWSLLKQCWSWDPKDRPEALFVVRVIETINSEDLLAEPEPNTMAPPYWTSRVSGTRAVSEITGTLEISGVSDLQRQQQSKLETVDEPMQLVPLSARLRLLRSAGYMQEQDNEAESISSERARVYESKVQQLMWKLDPKQIQTNIAGNVRGGTLPALVERLTMHGEFEETFIDSFLMTYKSFVTIEELFRLLVERYRISPPEGLTPQELEEWTEKKQKLRCRSLHNYSSMAALIAGLNSPCVRRLKRTWDGVHTRWTSMLDDLESTLDSGKNFAGYKQRLKQVDAPCVPFFGVYLTVLAFIQSRNKDFLSKEDGIINFGKRQKMAEVIREIQGYQAKQYNLTPVDQIQAFIEQSLAFIDEKVDYWDWSLKVEPREREDEKMTHMLQESGFL
ncbi:hypothetical protein FRC07_002781 [Ceratobasidium sp. 392]|nr:hypothetical protein FRC07_002781 [Ceratobasidium sp. 392]